MVLESFGRPSFIVDGNAGKLARWLRVLGYDASFAHPIDDGELVARALREERVLLTRDSGILARRLIVSGQVRAILLANDQVQAQLAQVVDTLALDTESFRFTRCLECNQELQECPREAAIQQVPPHVASTQQLFSQCPACDRIYWRGSHWQRINSTLSTMATDSPT